MTRGSIRKVPADLRNGDRIIFSTPMGGSGEVVTVDFISLSADMARVYIQESPGVPIKVLPHNTVKFGL